MQMIEKRGANTENYLGVDHCERSKLSRSWEALGALRPSSALFSAEAGFLGVAAPYEKISKFKATRSA